METINNIRPQIKPDFLFDEANVLSELKRYLPAQAPLKDFIFQNTLKAFQHLKYNDALIQASGIFGYRVSLPLEAFREKYLTSRIPDYILEHVIVENKGITHLEEWKERLLKKDYEHIHTPRIGTLRANWKQHYRIDLDSLVHPTLFRILCSYLDQGISMWSFPTDTIGFIHSIQELEKNSFTSFFNTNRAHGILLGDHHEITDLLKILIGDESLYEHYLFDQQFAHQGWSGLVSVIEQKPETLTQTRKITLHDIIVLELLLEIDALDNHFGEGNWKPMTTSLKERPPELFGALEKTELDEVLNLWQLAFEWSYYDQVLAGVQTQKEYDYHHAPSFQAMFCIDDRECSLRRYIEKYDPECETYGTPGFFNVEFYFQPDHGKFYTKLCPAPVTPKYLIKELEAEEHHSTDMHFTESSHSLLGGWMTSQTLGFWSALKLFLNIFRPSFNPAAASSFKHMDRLSTLSIVNEGPLKTENGLQIGFTIDEMASRVEGLLKSIGVTKHFAPIIYVIGHGASSINNPFYTTMDCGACSCRPGSVNARVFCFMANHKQVREILASHGIIIPDTTQFVGGIHDTTTDDIMYFDEEALLPQNIERHKKNLITFENALNENAKERSRRFFSIDTRLKAKKIHELVQKRAFSLFEPRPELDHATNALCIVGKRYLTRKLFLDRRSFLNSYDHKIDPTGKYLFNILKAATPVCGDINLAFLFSRVDNYKLGAGTKLPHNVMGLFGIANGIEGDLRPGLPSQMIESHDPIRLMMIVEHYPEVVLHTIQTTAAMYEYYQNEWMHLAVIHPDTRAIYYFKNGSFVLYNTVGKIKTGISIADMIENSDSQENLPVVQMA